MTALMLSSQRGHVSIVKLLIDAGADIDAKTAQESTSLMLACKRKHVAVARILVASGTELKLKDCKNRSVHETAVRKGNTELAKLLTDDAQVSSGSVLVTWHPVDHLDNILFFPFLVHRLRSCSKILGARGTL